MPQPFKRVFTTLPSAKAAMPQISKDNNTDCFVQAIGYGRLQFTAPLVETTEELTAMQTAECWQPIGTEYLIRLTDELITNQSEYILHYQHLPVKKTTTVQTLESEQYAILPADTDTEANDKSKMPYYEFHFTNTGYEFFPTGSKKAYSKMEIYLHYQADRSKLQMVSHNDMPGLEKMDKPGWKNGFLIPKMKYGKRDV